MANTLLTIQDITREALRILHNKLNFISNMDRQYDSRFGKTGAKIGSQLKIRLPNEYSVRTGRTANPQGTTERNETLTVATQKGIDMEFYSDELTLSLDDFSKRIIAPAIARLASEMEKDAFTMVKDVYNAVGTPGSTPAAMTTILNAGRKLDEFLAPDDGRCLIVNPAAQVSMVNALSSLFQSSQKLDMQYRKGYVASDTLGFDWYQNPLIPVLTTGSDHTTVTINGASQTGSTITMAGGNFKKGDILTIADVYAVHPETKEAYDFLQQFTVTADATTSVPISPSIIVSGAYQNVDSTPADSAVVTVAGTASTLYPMNIAFHPEAFTFVSADLETYADSTKCVVERHENISMRVWQASDIINDRLITRLDVLYGYLTTRAQLACRVWG